MVLSTDSEDAHPIPKRTVFSFGRLKLVWRCADQLYYSSRKKWQLDVPLSLLS